MKNQAAEIILDLTVTETDTDAERLEDLTGYLMSDLLELGVNSVERPEGDSAPDKAKGDAFTLGALALVAVPVLLPSLIAFLQAWTLQDEKREITIKTPAGLEVTFSPEKRLSEAELLELVEKLSSSSQEV